MSENETPRRSDEPSRKTARVSITLNTGDVIAVQLVDAHHPSAMVALPAGFGLGMPIGFSTNLILEELEESGAVTEYDCRVHSRRHSDGRDLYEMRLTSGTLAERRRLYEHGARLCKGRGGTSSLLHETRKMFRVQPDGEQRRGINIGILCAGEVQVRYPVTLGDISLTGMSVVVEEETEAELAAIDDVLITFAPCFFGHALAHPAVIRYRVQGERIVRYGLEFDAEDAIAFARFQLVLTDYIMRRQREILQGKAG